MNRLFSEAAGLLFMSRLTDRLMFSPIVPSGWSQLNLCWRMGLTAGRVDLVQPTDGENLFEK